MKLHTLSAAIFFLGACSQLPTRAPQSQEAVVLEATPYKVAHTFYKDSFVDLRSGYYLEKSDATFKGCVLWLEGLADSVRNHDPLFAKLNENGYRVIFFDYMGQGGSQGSMNDTRIYDPMNRTFEISSQAKFIWQKYSTVSANGKDCSQSPKMLIGWSTGGLAGYTLAHEQWPDAVVLITPGTNPKKFVGEAATNPRLMLSTQQIISERTLTRNKFVGVSNPHVDPIKPQTLTVIPGFAANLLITAELSQFWKIPSIVQGLAFISSPDDN